MTMIIITAIIRMVPIREKITIAPGKTAKVPLDFFVPEAMCEANCLLVVVEVPSSEHTGLDAKLNSTPGL